MYVLRSRKDGNYYIGQTNNIEVRIKQHMEGKVPSTKNRRPFYVVGYNVYKSRSESMWMEHELKNHSDKKRKFIDKLYKEKASGPDGPLAQEGVIKIV